MWFAELTATAVLNRPLLLGITGRDLLAFIGPITLVVSIVAVGFIYFRTTMAKTTLDLYKADNDALRSRITTLESEKADLQKEVAQTTGRISSLETANKVLADQVTGASAVRELSGQMEKNHRETFEAIKSIGLALEKLELRHISTEEPK